MRKLVILCLAVGLALASSEQWIGRSQDSYCTNSDPRPLVSQFTPMLFIDAADTLKYDDGLGGPGWYYYQGGNGWGVKFISPSDNVTLAGARMYIGSNTPGGTQALVQVFADDGINGSPGTQLFSDTATVTMGQWNLIPISVPIVASNFYIFYVQVGDSSFAPTLGLDAAENAPAHSQWQITSGSFSENRKVGDWAIQAVLDWTPQDTNASATSFSSSMTTDTLPNINFPIRAYVKNMGSDTLPVGMPVRLRITGPSSYEYQDTVMTTSALAHGKTSVINFTPVWHIPNVPGAYSIKVWTEAAGEMWPADDTISWDLSCAKWIEYFSEANLHWLAWHSPMRAAQFDPADFSLTYPVGISRVRADFVWDSRYPWPDSSFQFLVYGDDGQTLLFESETLEANPGYPGPFTACDLDSTLIFPSGTFYVAIAPVSTSGHPTSCGDTSAGGHSYYGQPGNWTLYTPPAGGGEYFISAAAQGNYGVEEEGFEPGIRNPSLQITNYPNPVTDQVTLKWQVPVRMPLSVNLYDATGRLMRTLYTANDKARVGTLTMDTRSLSAGIYLVRLETANGSATRKVVIDR
jgi:hypothetical protein